MNAPALVWMDELNAALDRAAHITPNAGRQLPNECDLFGVYVAAVKRARLAQGNPSAVNVERAKAARIAERNASMGSCMVLALQGLDDHPASPLQHGAVEEMHQRGQVVG